MALFRIRLQFLGRICLVLAGSLDGINGRSQCPYNVCGYWYSEHYNSGVPVEYVAVDLIGDMLIATKVLGDPWVQTGQVTWQGVPGECDFPGLVYGATGPGQPLISLPTTITIYSEDHIGLSTFGLQFYRTTTEHMDLMHVDYSPFPISCFTCDHPFPNVFTPNGDGVNDLLVPRCGTRSALFSIRDRWGALIFETRDLKPSWDGRRGWDPCLPGIYFWSMIDAQDRSGIIRHGVVHLLR